MPLLDISASYDEANNTQAVVVVNRDQISSQPVQFYWRDRKPQNIRPFTSSPEMIQRLPTPSNSRIRFSWRA
jgi:hypothetical protein